MTSTRFSPALMLGLGALVLPAAAQAQTAGDVGPYGTLKVGAEAVEDFDLTAFAPAGTFFFGEGSTGECGEGGCQNAAAVTIPSGSDTISGSIETDTGFAVAGALGYDFGMFRAEVEGSWSEADISGITITGASAGGEEIDIDDFDLEDACDGDPDCLGFFGPGGFGDAKIRQLGAMANVWLDIPLGEGIEPYIGGGAGVVDLKVTDSGADSETLFAWQLGAGVAVPVGDKMKITVDYRHREIDRPDFGSTSTEGIAAERIKSDAAFLGLRFYF